MSAVTAPPRLAAPWVPSVFEGERAYCRQMFSWRSRNRQTHTDSASQPTKTRAMKSYSTSPPPPPRNTGFVNSVSSGLWRRDLRRCHRLKGLKTVLHNVRIDEPNFNDDFLAFSILAL